MLSMSLFLFVFVVSLFVGNSLPLPQRSKFSRRLITSISLKVRSIESTPNPLSFKLGLDELILSSTNKIGQTFQVATPDCPEPIKQILALSGIESVYVMPDWVAVNKLPANIHSWDVLLPQCVLALGGTVKDSDAQDSLIRLENSRLKPLTPSTFQSEISSSTDNQICATIRMQASNGIPIQVEASNGLMVKRQPLSPRFASAIETLITTMEGRGGDDKMMFLKGRSWFPKGVLYADTLELALAFAADDVEALYPDDRLQKLTQSMSSTSESTKNQDQNLSLSELQAASNRDALVVVERLCTLASSLALDDASISGTLASSTGDSGQHATSLLLPHTAISTLTAFVKGGKGHPSARRMAIAFLGSCSGAGFAPYSDNIFEALALAFVSEKAAGLRRTAGDAFSDLGDPRAVSVAAEQLLEDPSKLVRWRAARILGELTGIHPQQDDNTATATIPPTTTIPTTAIATATKALETALTVEGQSFEVIFECMNSLSLLQNGERSVPVWQQMTKDRNLS